MFKVDGINSNIHNLELKLREKLAQLQFKEEALEKCQAQLEESQQLICKLQILLANERRCSSEMRLELKSSMEIIVQLEDEKIRGQTELVRLQMNWENAQIDREILLDQARKTKIENMQLQLQKQTLEANISEQKLLNKVLEQSFNDLKNQMNHLYPIIHSNVASLKKEQEYLRKSCLAMTRLNHRIDNIGQSILIKNRCDKKELQELRQKMASMRIVEASQVPPTPNPSNIDIPGQLEQLASSNKVIDKKLEDMCKKLEHLESETF